VALFVAICAQDLGLLRLVRPFLSAELGNMAKFTTIVALGTTGVHDFSSIVKTGKQLLATLRERLSLPRSVRLVREAIRNAELLSHVALEIHVGEDGDQGSLSGNQEKINAFVEQAFLEFSVGDSTTRSLNVLLDGFLCVIHISLQDGLFDLVPGFIRGEISNVISVHLACILAVVSRVSWILLA